MHAVAACLRERSYSVSGASSRRGARAAATAASSLNRLPAPWRRQLYARSGHLQTIHGRDAGRVDAEAVAEWLVEQLPGGRYPAVVIGSAGGALAHLCAALGVPFLPQNFLVTLRQPGRHVDDAATEVKANRPHAARLLAANPNVTLHQMQDPNQDRLMLATMSYMRVKWQRLPLAYERYLQDVLEPGGSVIVSDCRLRWPTTRLGPRHVFQFGGVGGLAAPDYREPSASIAAYLERHGSPVRHWSPPAADEDSPEAEWGFEPRLLESLGDLARRCGWKRVRLSHAEPESLSEPVADLYRDWYSSHGFAPDRLLVSSFALLDPWTALRTKSVPFWTTFSVRSAAERLRDHLDRCVYDDIAWTAFPHGIESIGIAGLEAWVDLAGRAAGQRSLGLDHRRFPADLAAFARYRADLDALPRRGGPLPPVTLDRAREAFTDHPAVAWVQED